VREWLEQALGRKAAGRIVAVTTEGKGDLFSLAQAKALPRFRHPENVGGRFSVLSPAGLVPAALIGIDIRKAHARRRAHDAPLLAARSPARISRCARRSATGSSGPAKRSPSRWRSLTPITCGARPSGSASFGPNRWARRATARARKFTPARRPVAALGTTDQHSQVQLYIEGPNDKVFTFWAVAKFSSTGKIPKRRFNLPAFDALAGRSLAELIDAERRATAAALVENGHPNCTVTLDRVDEEHLGAFLQMMEFETAFMGELLDINAFDQEGVELGQKVHLRPDGPRGLRESTAASSRLTNENAKTCSVYDGVTFCFLRESAPSRSWFGRLWGRMVSCAPIVNRCSRAQRTNPDPGSATSDSMEANEGCVTVFAGSSGSPGLPLRLSGNRAGLQ
jgi:glucose-6-phosphate isomerase